MERQPRSLAERFRAVRSRVREKVERFFEPQECFGFLEDYAERNRKVPITKDFIWAGGSADKGWVASNVVGLIETIHNSLSLTITPPYLLDKGRRRLEEELAKEKDHVRRSILWYLLDPNRPEEIGSAAKSHRLEIHSYNESWIKAARELDDLTLQLTQLNENLKGLQINQAGTAHNLLQQVEEKRDYLQKHMRETQERIDKEHREHTPTRERLLIRSLNGDITIQVKDPEVSIEIENRNHRTQPPEITGNPPRDSKRAIGVFTYRGKIAIIYPLPPIQSGTIGTSAQPASLQGN